MSDILDINLWQSLNLREYMLAKFRSLQLAGKIDEDAPGPALPTGEIERLILEANYPRQRRLITHPPPM